MEYPKPNFSVAEAGEFSEWRREQGVELERLSGVPVYSVSSGNVDATIPKLIDSFGEHTVLRVINSDFLNDAVESGTDRVNIDEHDFRSLIHYITAEEYGLDVWGVDHAVTGAGHTASDVLCCTTYEQFRRQRGDAYRGRGLGLPDDRLAILVYNGDSLSKIEGTDGYVFRDPSQKKSALLGVVRVKENLLEFEERLRNLQSADAKIMVLRSVIDNMQNTDDLQKVLYVALNIVTLLRQESANSTWEKSSSSERKIQELNDLVERLKEERQHMLTVQSYVLRIENVKKWLNEKNSSGTETIGAPSPFDHIWMIKMPQVPDEIIRDLDSALSGTEIPEKYKDQLRALLEQAIALKEEMSLMAKNGAF